MAEGTKTGEVTRRIFIRGMVQGVGMRPFLALLAREYGIAGSVKNIGSNVELVVRARESILDAFVEAIRVRKPETAEIVEIKSDGMDASIPDSFDIVASSPGSVSMLPADFPVCAECAREMNDQANRRYRHPFISCAVCGPRYSIFTRAPYDRANTTMADFPMCPDCAREYNDPQSRRYHAETISCHACGPYLIYHDGGGQCIREAALAAAKDALKSGGIVAVKGVGGYHLACDPQNEAAVHRLRELKGRELKPFAVMFRGIDEIEKACVLTPPERELLLSPARPIVLLETKGAPFAPSVSGGVRTTGAFLPYTPLQMLLLEDITALVMTSANRTGRPEIYEDTEMLAMLEDGALTGVLANARRIVTRLDDSVAKHAAGLRQTVRRSRGYAPRPVFLPIDNPKSILAFGSDLKSAFCLLSGSEAYMSPYFGDMEELEVQRAYEANLRHMRDLFTFEPALAACDMHPSYHASRLARESGMPLTEVQHHHAHIASVAAEHSLTGSVIGVAFDGTGWGEDGAIWGGEYLLCEGGGYTRRAHMKYVPLAGGDSVAVDARKAALCYCMASGVHYSGFDGADLLRAALVSGTGTFRYSGMGRLFDAVASLLGICQFNGYEGQCAIALENEALKAAGSGVPPLPMEFEFSINNGIINIDSSPVIRAVAGAAKAGQAGNAALGFHEAVCRMAAEACRRIRDESGVNAVALSGGTFQNGLILSGAVRLLQESGFSVYTNNEVPCNDGGLALGQAYAAAMKRMEGPHVCRDAGKGADD